MCFATEKGHRLSVSRPAASWRGAASSLWRSYVSVGLNSTEKSVEVRSNCYRIVQRQRHKYHQAALLFYSLDRIELLGEGLHRIPSSYYRSNKYHTNVITNLKNTNDILLLAGDRPVYILLTIVRSPLHNPFPVVNSE